MFDPTTRLQSARMHGHDLHHAARHSTPHAADHALRRAADHALRRARSRNTGDSLGRVTGDAAPRPTRALVPVQGAGVRRSPGRLASLLTSIGSRTRRPAPEQTVPIAVAVPCRPPLDRQSA